MASGMNDILSEFKRSDQVDRELGTSAYGMRYLNVLFTSLLFLFIVWIYTSLCYLVVLYLAQDIFVL